MTTANMTFLAYCGLTFYRSTVLATGLKHPMTCPPITADTLDPSIFEGAKLLYFDFHGLPELPSWFEEVPHPSGFIERITALTAEQIHPLDLNGVTVFSTACYLGDQGSDMLKAFVLAGAQVVAGEGKNWSSASRPQGASKLGATFCRVFLQSGDASIALKTAKRNMNRRRRLDGFLRRTDNEYAAADALQFTLYTQETLV